MVRRLILPLTLLVVAGCQEVEPDPGPSEVRAPRAVPAEAPATPAVPRADAVSDTVVVVFFGDSLTAGYGLDSPRDAYPALVEAQIAEAGVPVRVVNAGVSGETSAGGLGRINWALRQTTPDVFVLALGANDGLRGVDPDVTEQNLNAILARVHESAPEARLVVAGMEALPNMGPTYTDRFRTVFPAVAEAHGAALVPFLLEDVAGVARLNQGDGVHPTAEGQRIVARTVGEVVVPIVHEVYDDAS